MHNHPFKPARSIVYMSLAQERAWAGEHPIGDPWGGPAYGEKNKGGIFSNSYWEKGGVVNSVVSLVTNPIGYTNDRLKELDKTVIQPIGHGLEKVGQGIANDPITFVATVAAVATGNAYLVPLITMASTAAKGGSFEDVLKAGAISAATTVIAVEGSNLLMGTMKVAQGAATTYQIAGQQISQTTARVIAQGVSYAAAGATTAAVTGKNVGQAALTGAITGGLAGGAQGLAQADFMKDFAATIDKVATSGVGNAVVNGIAGAAGAALTGAITGQDASTQIGMALVGGAVNGIASAVKISGDFFSNNAAEALDLEYDDYGPRNDTRTVAQYLTDKLGPAGAGFVTNSVTSILTSTFTKGNPSAFLAQQIMGNLTQSIKNAFDPNFKARYVDPLSGYISDAEEAAKEYNASANQQNALGEQINANVTTYNNRVAAVNQIINERSALADKYNGYTSANSSQAQVNDTYAKIQALDSQIKAEVTSINNFYQTGIIDKQAQYAQLNDQTLALQKTYVGYADALGDASVPLTKYLNDVTKDMAIKTAQTLDPSFDPEEYRTINGLSPTDDVGAHYISTGKDQGLYTNEADATPQRDTYLDAATQRLYRGQGWDITQVPKDEYEKTKQMLGNFYGYNLKALQEFTPDSLVKQSGMPATWYAPMWDEQTKTLSRAVVLFQGAEPETGSVTGSVGISDTKLPAGMSLATFYDIQNGKANMVRGTDGNYYWTTNTGSAAKIYDENVGGMAGITYSTYFADKDVPAGAFDITRDSQGRVVGYRTPDGGMNITVIGAGDVADESPYKNVGTPFNDLDPLVQMYTYSSTPDGIAANFNVKGIVQASKDIVDYMQKDASDINKLKIATIVKSAGSVMQDVGTVLGDLSVTIGLSKTNNSTLANLGKQLEGLAEAKTPEQYKAAMADIEAMRKAAKGTDIVAVNAAIAQKYPDLVGISVFGGELFEELIQNGVGKAAMVAGGALAATLGAPALIAGAIGAGVGYGTAMAMDFSESYRGAKEDMYQRMYDIYKEKGYSDAQANQMADAAATKAGVMNGLITMVVNGATPGDLNKVLFGGKASPAQEAITNYFVDKLVTAGKVAASEFGQGLVEGTLQGMYNETLVYSVDPSKADYAKGMADSAMLESIIGAPVSVGAYAVDNSFEMAQRTFTLANEQFTTALESGNIHTVGELGAVFKSWGVPQAVAADVVPDIVKNNQNLLEAYPTANDLSTALTKSFGFYDPQWAEIANTKFNDQVITTQEAKDMLLAAGLTNVTDKDALVATGIRDTKTTTAANWQNQANANVANYANQQMVSAAEVQAAAAQENYTYTQAELDKLVGRGVQADVIAKFIAEIDPKAVTTAEATQYFKDLGYTKATAADIAQFVKSAPEEAMKTAVAEWVNPRQVTRAEALQFFSQLGYTPSEAEITQFVVQGPEVFQDAIKTKLGEYVDPRYVDAAEVREAFKNMGLNAPVAASDVLRLSGQYSESELASKAKAELPVVSSNAMYALMAGDAAVGQQVKDAILAKLAEYRSLNMSEAEAQRAATQAIAAQLGTTQTNLLTALGATESNLLVKLQNVETTLSDRIELYRKEGLTQSEATKKALEEMSTQLGTTKEDLLGKLGATESNLLTKLAESEAKTTGQILGVQTDLANAKSTILTQMQAYEQAGIDRDTALNLAISGVAQDLGVAKTDLLARMGTSEATLRSEIGTAKTELTGQIQNVQQALGRQTQQATAADLAAIQGMVAGTTPVNLAYDTNNDGKVDATDVTNVQQQIAFQQQQNLEQQIDPNTGLPVWIDKTTNQPITQPSLGGSQWEATGIYKVLQDQAAQQAATAKAQAATAKQTAQKQNFSQMMQMVLGAPDAAGQKVEVKEAPLAQIRNIYDFSSIFATPQQASMFPSPYGPVNTYGQNPQQGGVGGLGGLYGQAANNPMYKQASGFAGGGMINGEIEVGDGGSVDDLLNILKGNG